MFLFLSGITRIFWAEGEILLLLNNIQQILIGLNLPVDICTLIPDDPLRNVEGCKCVCCCPSGGAGHGHEGGEGSVGSEGRQGRQRPSWTTGKYPECSLFVLDVLP